MTPLPSAPAARRLWVAGTALTALAAVATAVFSLYTTPAEAAAPRRPPATPVSVATVVQSDVAAWDEFSGRLEAVERVDIRSRVAGAVQSVHFREGALVKQGDLLITHRPGAVRGRGRARRGAGRRRRRRASSYTRSEHERASRLWDEQRHRPARARRAQQRRARGRGQPARRAGRAADARA